MEYYLAIKENEILPFARIQMDLESFMLSFREKQIYYFTYMWNLKNKINEQKQTCRYREQTDGCQREGDLGAGQKR